MTKNTAVAVAVEVAPNAILIADALFELQLSLFTQSQNAARWSSNEIRHLRDERWETAALGVEVDRKQAEINQRSNADRESAKASLETATRKVLAMRSSATLGPALTAINVAQHDVRRLMTQ